VSKKTETYVVQMLARAMYHKWCDHKNLTPRPYPYTDAGSNDYAITAVDLLGYDDDSIKNLEDFLVERGDIEPDGV
jgi:hypothetical protein